MKSVLEHIESKRVEFQAAALFQQHLAQRQPDPVRALWFMKHAAHFVMAFSDLNKFCLREPSASDRWQDVVNEHTLEDDHHWPWYLDDLATLGIDDVTSFADALRFIWGDDNRATRVLSYRLWAMAEPADSLERLVIIEAIEATGEVFFSHLVDVAKQISSERLERPLLYVADHHFAVEQGHSAGRTDAEHGLENVRLTRAARERYANIVDQVFVYFRDWVDELHRNAQAITALELEVRV